MSTFPLIIAFGLVFGAVIINNINKNLKLSVDDKMVKMCEECGERVKLSTPNSPVKYCEKCAKKIKQEQVNKLKRENRRNKK